MKHCDCDSILGNDLTEIKLPTCHLRADRTARAERPVLLTGVQSKDDCGRIVICHQMSSTD